MNIAAKECEVTEVNARASQQQRPSSTSGISSEGSEQGGPKTCLSKKGNSSPKGTTKSPIKSKRRGSSKSYFGDEDFSFDSDVLAQGLRNAEDEVSFEEICYSCCYRGAREWLRIVAILVSLLGCLYFFLFGLQLMGNASKVMAGCASGQLFASEENPISSVVIGILTTVLLQSSSAVVAIVVSLEEAKAIGISSGIYTIMGANIGTTITSALVTLGQMRDLGELERGVSAAAVHSLFNFMTVVVLFPIERAFGYLEGITGLLVENAETGGKEDSYVGPIKKLVQPLVDLVIISNSKLITGVAKGKSCDDFYPIECDPDLDPSFKTCKVGLIACNKASGSCPLFFRENATIEEDKVSGGLTFILALVVVIVSTMGMIVTIKLLLHGLSVRVVHAVTRCNGYFGILFGGALTVFVQSSQAVVSTLVPVAGVGALPLETIYPIVVGSNVGTALQTVMVSFSAFGTAPLQVALAHLFFNITGMMLWYPIPHLRVIPMWAARKLGQGAKIWRLFPLISIVIMYVAIPLLVWGLSNLFLTGHKAAQVFVIVFGILGVLCLGYLVYWFSWNGGVEKCVKFFSKVKSISGSEFTDESSGALSLSGDVESDSQFLRQSKTIGHSKAPCSLSNVEEDKPMEVFEESESERSNASLSC